MNPIFKNGGIIIMSMINIFKIIGIRIKIPITVVLRNNIKIAAIIWLIPTKDLKGSFSKRNHDILKSDKSLIDVDNSSGVKFPNYEFVNLLHP